jgi:hypothetical protein
MQGCVCSGRQVRIAYVMLVPLDGHAGAKASVHIRTSLHVTCLHVPHKGGCKWRGRTEASHYCCDSSASARQANSEALASAANSSEAASSGLSSPAAAAAAPGAAGPPSTGLAAGGSGAGDCTAALRCGSLLPWAVVCSSRGATAAVLAVAFASSTAAATADPASFAAAQVLSSAPCTSLPASAGITDPTAGLSGCAAATEPADSLLLWTRSPAPLESSPAAVTDGWLPAEPTEERKDGVAGTTVPCALPLLGARLCGGSGMEFEGISARAALFFDTAGAVPLLPPPPPPDARHCRACCCGGGGNDATVADGGACGSSGAGWGSCGSAPGVAAAGLAAGNTRETCNAI